MKKKIIALNPLRVLYYFCLTVITVRLTIFFAVMHKHTPAIYWDDIHLHHFFFGFIFLILALWATRADKCPNWLFEILVGISIALVFDEFLFWTFFDFSYWDLGNLIAILALSGLGAYWIWLNPKPVEIRLHKGSAHHFRLKKYSLWRHLVLPWGSFVIVLLILFRKM